MPENTDVLAIEPVNGQQLSFSIKESAAAMNCSEGSIKSYKSVVLEAFKVDKSRVVLKTGSLTSYGLEQLKIARGFISNSDKEGYFEKVWTEMPDLKPSLDSGVGNDQQKLLPGAGFKVGWDVEVPLIDSEFVDEGGEFQEKIDATLDRQKGSLAKSQDKAISHLSGLKKRLKTYYAGQIRAIKREALAEALADTTVEDEIFSFQESENPTQA